jgi:tetratricopeptide (TPR) repeat protein
MEVITSVAEIYRENEEYVLLAMHYHSMGNCDLRDKYIELAIDEDPGDQIICSLRALQGRPELIPPEVAKRRLESLTSNEDWEQRARFYDDLGKPVEALKDYVRGIGESLDQNSLFGAAYYLKEVVTSGLVNKLFTLAYEEAKAKNDLWWMTRALEELGWKDELKSVVLKKAKEIEQSGNPHLLLLLAKLKGDNVQAVELTKEIARGTHLVRHTKADPKP